MAVDWTPIIVFMLTIQASINAWEVKEIIDIKERLAGASV